MAQDNSSQEGISVHTSQESLVPLKVFKEKKEDEASVVVESKKVQE